MCVSKKSLVLSMVAASFMLTTACNKYSSKAVAANKIHKVDEKKEPVDPTDVVKKDEIKEEVLLSEDLQKISDLEEALKLASDEKEVEALQEEILSIVNKLEEAAKNSKSDYKESYSTYLETVDARNKTLEALKDDTLNDSSRSELLLNLKSFTEAAEVFDGESVVKLQTAKAEAQNFMDAVEMCSFCEGREVNNEILEVDDNEEIIGLLKESSSIKISNLTDELIEINDKIISLEAQINLDKEDKDSTQMNAMDKTIRVLELDRLKKEYKEKGLELSKELTTLDNLKVLEEQSESK